MHAKKQSGYKGKQIDPQSAHERESRARLNEFMATYDQSKELPPNILMNPPNNLRTHEPAIREIMENGDRNPSIMLLSKALAINHPHTARTTRALLTTALGRLRPTAAIGDCWKRLVIYITYITILWLSPTQAAPNNTIEGVDIYYSNEAIMLSSWPLSLKPTQYHEAVNMEILKNITSIMSSLDEEIAQMALPIIKEIRHIPGACPLTLQMLPTQASDENNKYPMLLHATAPTGDAQKYIIISHEDQTCNYGFSPAFRGMLHAFTSLPEPYTTNQWETAHKHYTETFKSRITGNNCYEYVKKGTPQRSEDDEIHDIRDKSQGPALCAELCLNRHDAHKAHIKTPCDSKAKCGTAPVGCSHYSYNWHDRQCILNNGLKKIRSDWSGTRHGFHAPVDCLPQLIPHTLQIKRDAYTVVNARAACTLRLKIKGNEKVYTECRGQALQLKGSLLAINRAYNNLMHHLSPRMETNRSKRTVFSKTKAGQIVVDFIAKAADRIAIMTEPIPVIGPIISISLMLISQLLVVIKDEAQFFYTDHIEATLEATSKQPTRTQPDWRAESIPKTPIEGYVNRPAGISDQLILLEQTIARVQVQIMYLSTTNQPLTNITWSYLRDKNYAFLTRFSKNDHTYHRYYWSVELTNPRIGQAMIINLHPKSKMIQGRVLAGDMRTSDLSWKCITRFKAWGTLPPSCYNQRQATGQKIELYHLLHNKIIIKVTQMGAILQIKCPQKTAVMNCERILVIMVDNECTVRSDTQTLYGPSKRTAARHENNTYHILYQSSSLPAIRPETINLTLRALNRTLETLNRTISSHQVELETNAVIDGRLQDGFLALLTIIGLAVLIAIPTVMVATKTNKNNSNVAKANISIQASRFLSEDSLKEYKASL